MILTGLRLTIPRNHWASRQRKAFLSSLRYRHIVNNRRSWEAEANNWVRWARCLLVLPRRVLRSDCPTSRASEAGATPSRFTSGTFQVLAS
jgi:hypothetical protein